ncbi:hypothetical protein GBA65_03555 [Rubrobacter marinus]|uniref:Rhodanese domain-containing protein n=1 Tax=Rubrobacter marinus TaxID=2653852 RepID=A0A6G8PTT6_9ACTN|nr:rhodanese-like domain-containing protein [Rubrobacter marinus]QIN77743.1 hypothetical protein GBA65_03555 [Rubrobacter marinus]
MGVARDKPTILYCLKGARTSNTYLAIKMLGYDNVRTCFGSRNGWSRAGDLPMERGAPQKVAS